MKMITCDAMIGLPRQPLDSGDPTPEDLEQEMDRLRIDAAIVRHRFCLESSPYAGNRILMEEIQGHSRLIPAWVLTPDGQEPDYDAARTVRSMLDSGVRVAWMRPKEHTFSVQPWCSGELYAALQDARVPLLIDWNAQTPDDLNAVCAAFPELRLVVLNPSREGRHRLMYPLLKQHPHLYLCFSPVFSAHDVFMDLCGRFGPHRWVLGTGYPQSEGGAGITGLLYSGLPEAAIRAVASENIERLLAEVKA